MGLYGEILHGIFKPRGQKLIKTPFMTRVSAAADRPARRSGSAHAKYSDKPVCRAVCQWQRRIL